MLRAAALAMLLMLPWVGRRGLAASCQTRGLDKWLRTLPASVLPTAHLPPPRSSSLESLAFLLKALEPGHTLSTGLGPQNLQGVTGEALTWGGPVGSGRGQVPGKGGPRQALKNTLCGRGAESERGLRKEPCLFIPPMLLTLGIFVKNSIHIYEIAPVFPN